MFEWNEDVYGIRPVEGVNGSFGGRETRFETCACGAGSSYFTDNGEYCEPQSAALHAEFHGLGSVEELNQTLEASLRGMGIIVFIGVANAEEAEALGFNPVANEPSTPPTDDDWPEDGTSR